MEERTLFITNMPASRIADYYIGYMDGCVFIDFNNCGENRVCLKRISFDGYGCCELSDDATPINEHDSQSFKDLIQKNPLDQDSLLIIIKKAISLNKNEIWPDALEEYHLV
jgi:hypothetical protein